MKKSRGRASQCDLRARTKERAQSQHQWVLPLGAKVGYGAVWLGESYRTAELMVEERLSRILSL